MGCCASMRSGNIQQTGYRQKMQQSLNEPQLSNLVTQLYNIFTQTDRPEEDKNQILAIKLQPNGLQNAKQIAQSFLKILNPDNKGQNQSARGMISEYIVVASYIVASNKYAKGFTAWTRSQSDSLAQFILKEDNENILIAWVQFVQSMYLDQGLDIFSQSQLTFQALLQKFSLYTNDQIRQKSTQIIVQMLKDNKQLLKYANSPYYFLEYWLYEINKQTQIDRQLHWIESVTNIYGSDKNSSDYLFHENDFRVFIDLLVRVLSECPQCKQQSIVEKFLKTPLQCYLVLSCSKYMIPTLLRIDDIRECLAYIQPKLPQIQQLIKQINSLK